MRAYQLAPTRPWLIVLPLLLLATAPGLVARAGAQTGSDEYIAGYAAAVLERELHRPAPSLRVDHGIVTLDAADLKGIDRDAVARVLEQIRGVVRVTVVDVPAAPPAPTVAAPTTPPVVVDLHTGLFPGGDHLFRPLMADPRWPHFAVTYQSYIDDKRLNNVAAVSFGETLTFYRDTYGPVWWSLALQAGVFAVFDLDAQSMDLVNADYFVAPALSARYGQLSALARIFHQSSHLGDEFLLANRINRLNLSFEGLDLKLSYDFYGDVLRVYGGGGYLFDRDPTELKPGALQWGLEFRSPWPGEGARVRPIAAVDVQNRQENDWQSDVSVRAGVELRGLWSERDLQVMLEYFRGHSPNGQFYRQKVDYLGLGLHFHF
jgi:uncharacterized protein DUF1207